MKKIVAGTAALAAAAVLTLGASPINFADQGGDWPAWIVHTLFQGGDWPA